MELILMLGGIVLVLALILGLMSLSAAILMWAWNLAVPLFWAAAPTLTFWPALAVVVLLGFIANVFNRTTVNNNKKD